MNVRTMPRFAKIQNTESVLYSSRHFKYGVAIAIISGDFILMKFQLDANVSRKVASRCHVAQGDLARQQTRGYSSRLQSSWKVKSEAARSLTRFAFVFTKEGRKEQEPRAKSLMDLDVVTITLFKERADNPTTYRHIHCFVFTNLT